MDLSLLNDLSKFDVVYLLENAGIEKNSQSYDDYRDAQKIVMLPLIPEPNKEKVRTAILNYLNLKE